MRSSNKNFNKYRDVVSAIQERSETDEAFGNLEFEDQLKKLGEFEFYLNTLTLSDLKEGFADAFGMFGKMLRDESIKEWKHLRAKYGLPTE